DDQVAEMSSVNLQFASNQPMSLTLYDSTGRLLDTSSTASTTGTQSTISLALGAAVQRGNGVYFVRVAPQTSANSWNYKLDFAGQSFNRAGGIFLPSYSPVVVEESASRVVSKRLGLRLDSQPLAPVTLRLTTTSTGTTRAGTVSPETLTFTPTNWNLYQGVTVTPIDDLLPDGDQTLSIVASATSADPGYNNKVLKFDALVLDNEDPPAPAVVDRTQSADLPLVFLTGMGQAVSESTSTLSYNVALSKPVASDTYVGFAFDEGTATLGQDFTVSTGFVRDFRSMDFGVGGIKIAAGATVPAFADIDGDGDVDLLVGSASGPMQFYRNVGSKTTPRFEFQSGANDPFSNLGGPALGGYTHPAFADVDGDGRIDLVVGSQTGLNFYRNDGTTTSPGVHWVAMSISPFPALATLNGSFFAPTFADLDGDGDQDLFISRRGDTNVAYFERTGTATFTRNDAKLTTAGIGGLGTTDTPTIGFADLDGDGDLDAFIGLSTATFARLNEGTRTSPNFPTSGFARFREVTSAVKDAAWISADLNGDGIPEEIGGDVGGRLRAFTTYQALLIPKGSTRATVTLTINNDLIAEGTVDPAQPQLAKKEDIGVRVLESPFYAFGKYTVKKVVENGVEKEVDVPADVTDTYDADQDGNKTEILPAVYAGTLGIQDNDTAGFVTQVSDATVTEAGKRVAFGVKLATQPIADVSVYVGSSDVTEGLIVNGTNAGAETSQRSV
ncbi:MAG: VCBS repeat-containing protein, partial [Planctomycetota bacterium]|nr:VCBS repeat-containing protein [Planctomycetota bacterium]